MLETSKESAQPVDAELLASSGEWRKIPDRRHGPPSDRVDTYVTRNHLPLAALKWVAVVFGALMMLVVVPVVDLAGSALSRLRRLLSAPSA